MVDLAPSSNSKNHYYQTLPQQDLVLFVILSTIDFYVDLNSQVLKHNRPGFTGTSVLVWIQLFISKTVRQTDLLLSCVRAGTRQLTCWWKLHAQYIDILEFVP